MSIPPSRISVKRRIYYGWWLVLAGSIAQMLQSSLLFLSQGAYLIEFQHTFGWSRSSISGAFAILRVESGLVGPVQGWMIDRFGPRPVMIIGILGYGFGFILLGQIQTLWHLYIAFGLLAVGASMAGFLTTHTAIANWFIRKRARAMSLSSMGFAAGALIAPIVAWSLLTFGWRDTAVSSGILVLLVGLPAASFFRRSPERYGLLPDGDTPEQVAARRKARGLGEAASYDDEIHFTVKEAMRDRSFWLVSFGHGMALLVVTTLPVHLVPYLVDENGWNPAATALVFPAIMAIQIIGQISGGIFGDRYAKHIVAGIAMLGHGAGMMVLAFSASPFAVGLAIVLHGLAWGARGPLMMAIRADYFGRKNLGLISGWSNVITIIGSIIGPIYAALMFDNTGTYFTAFWTMGLLTMFSTFAFFIARRPPPPTRVGGV